jgi:hypothetical protein
MPDSTYLFHLSRFSDLKNRIVLTDDKITVKYSILHSIEDSGTPLCVYPFFENSIKSKYFCDEMGYGLFEKRDTVLFMKYHLDFDGKYFNENLDHYEFTDEEERYFATRSPLHNEDYILQPFYAGLRRTGTLLIRLKDNRVMFIKKLIQDRNDIFDFSIIYTCGYDCTTNEFYGTSNYLDMDNITNDKDKNVVRQKMPPEVQPFLLRHNAEATTNGILMFYKLKQNIEFPNE